MLAIATWTEADQYVWSNRWTPNGGWGAAERISGNDGSIPVGFPQVAVDGSGSAVAVWLERDRPIGHIWSNRWTSSGGWGTAELIDDEDAGEAFEPRLAVNSNGNALAVWEAFLGDGTQVEIWSNRRTPSGGWGTSERISAQSLVYPTLGNSPSPQVTIDASGNAAAVWSQEDGVWSNRFEKE
jgi:hypothetical protein